MSWHIRDIVLSRCLVAKDGKRSSMRPARIGICPRAPAPAIRPAALLSWIPPDLSSIDCCIQAEHRRSDREARERGCRGPGARDHRGAARRWSGETAHGHRTPRTTASPAAATSPGWSLDSISTSFPRRSSAIGPNSSYPHPCGARLGGGLCYPICYPGLS